MVIETQLCTTCSLMYHMVVTQEFVLGVAVGIGVSQQERHLPHC